MAGFADGVAAGQDAQVQVHVERLLQVRTASRQGWALAYLPLSCTGCGGGSSPTVSSACTERQVFCIY